MESGLHRWIYYKENIINYNHLLLLRKLPKPKSKKSQTYTKFEKTIDSIDGSAIKQNHNR